MPDCMRELGARGLRAAVLAAARTKPFLGICIGLQMLFDRSEEGDVEGLGVLRGRVRRFSPDAMIDAAGARLKVPHMGWNRVRQATAHELWKDIANDSRFYFVHSYYVEPAEPALSAGVSEYPRPFTCAIARDNVFAVQFHPEKSDRMGLQMLANFARWRPASVLPRPSQTAPAGGG
jgi:glutamine amidotransferase